MDMDDCANDDKISIILNTQDDTKNKENHEENCTPFCHCTCCASTIIFQVDIAEKQSVKYLLQKEYAPINFTFSTNNANAIWQPPKQVYI
jgi:hypothetical protein